MLAFVSDLLECDMEAADGELGKVQDLYVDSAGWKVRYIVADTWKTMPGKRVMLAPICINELDLAGKIVKTGLDKQTIRNSPGFAGKSAPRKVEERDLAEYYGWPLYWKEESPDHAEGVLKSGMNDEIEKEGTMGFAEKAGDQLQSQISMTAYRVHTSNGRLGKVVDAIFDKESWTIQSFVIQLKYQTEMGFLLVSTEELIACEWTEGDFYLGETVQEMKRRPIYRTRDEMHEYLPNL